MFAIAANDRRPDTESRAYILTNQADQWVRAYEEHAYVEEYDGHTIVYDQGPTSWGAYVEDLPVCFSVGATFEECEIL